MDWRTRQVARIGVTALGVAGGLMLMATTGQTTDGFVNANFDGSLSLFGASPSDNQAGVMAIGDGSSDATELATLLSSTGTTAAKAGPLRVAFTPGAAPNASEIRVFPAMDPSAARISDQALALPNKPVVDMQGHIDCSGAVSCSTDPLTNITTVAYADGVVALVQKINDTTMVAYKTITAAVPTRLQNLFPPAPATAPVPAAAAASAPSDDPAAATEAPAADPAAAPLPDITAATVRPRLTITSPPADYAPGNTGSVTGNPLQLPTNVTNPVDVVKDAVSSVVNAIGGVVNNALKPGNHNGSRTKSPSSATTSN